MITEVKAIYMTFIQDPEFSPNAENREKDAWEAAWRRYRQSRRNEKALNLSKHDVEKFHTHSKTGKLLKPLTDYFKTNSPKMDFTKQWASFPTEEYPNMRGKIGEPSKLPKEEKKEVEYQSKKPLRDSSRYPDTALERLKEKTDNIV